ncbi:delta and Notch-like epidermal growth factor-related receptor [Schistocerca americana]|uniref:delta and Notch-like epidermal growth factor-related receptor n=1 Tax=Schistocerca americana TaxID=7009 RepID=UPI001F4FE838|nr:delta and Notch-like epidermal growth factor-related receptor [Schistocerca americana]
MCRLLLQAVAVCQLRPGPPPGSAPTPPPPPALPRLLAAFAGTAPAAASEEDATAASATGATTVSTATASQAASSSVSEVAAVPTAAPEPAATTTSTPAATPATSGAPSSSSSTTTTTITTTTTTNAATTPPPPPITFSDGNPAIEEESSGSPTALEGSSGSSAALEGLSTAEPRPPLPPPRPPHRIPSRLEEKLESLSCDIPPLPSESRLWRGNETHELLLPIIVTPDCEGEEAEEGGDCAPVSVSWEGGAELQSGDVLLVRIDDTRLVAGRQASARTRPGHLPGDRYGPPQDDRRRQPETAVYQVTRPGHDHCDVTEGVLLDITPLIVDGRKVVTLYDKDLTEGINLLIVVSERWGGQCVRLRVLVKSDNCGENQDCSAKGVCFSNISMEGYECQCCPGFVGPHCEERDACYPSPCRNNGICVDLSQGQGGNSFQCLCPYGFTGKTCESEADPCGSAPCQNGATCVRNATHFRCVCPTGFAGEVCQQPLNQCESSPCKHGICVEQEDGYRCFCRPGFTGMNCEYEYNECESSPCMNGGTCTDQVGRFSCACGRGYTGNRCQVKVDLCDPNPCHDHHYCVDRGNNYTCECPKGFSGPDCLIPSRAACSVNPCRHGGTCWSSVDSFYCACRPGYTGKTCQEEFVLEAMPSAMPRATGRDGQLDLQMPISIHLDHLHNVYIAAGTLACAVVIVVLTVAACHCRVHETYKRCFLNASPLLPCKLSRLDDPKSPSSSRERDRDRERERGKAGPAGGGGRFPALDTGEMYYTLDFSDSQSSPLIQ